MNRTGGALKFCVGLKILRNTDFVNYCKVQKLKHITVVYCQWSWCILFWCAKCFRSHHI